MWLDYRFGGTRTSSEQFNCAGRTILTGLIAVDIVSHWCAAVMAILQAASCELLFLTGPI